MNTITIVRNSGIAAAAIMLAVFVAVAPTAKAADLGGDYGSSYADYGSYTSPADYGSSYADYGSYTTPTDYGSSYADYGSYTTPTSYDYTSPSSYFGGMGYGGYGFGGMGGYGFSNPGYGFGGGVSSSNSSTYAPTTVSTYAPTNTCTAPNSCNSSVDDHSIFNAPTTVTISNPAPTQTQTQVVYQPVPVYNNPAPAPCYTCQAPVVYPTPVRQPYVSLTQVPYTGLDLGPVGTVLYWGFLVLWCLVAAYLIVYKRVQTKVVSGLNNFLFGAPAKVGTHAKVVMPAAKAHVAPAAKAEDAIDPFIASQIARLK